METKTVDSKGRLTLGPEFAGKTVILRRRKHGITITPAVVIPEHEAWLYKNPEAHAAVEHGLADAKRGQFSKNPPQIDPQWAEEDLDE